MTTYIYSCSAPTFKLHFEKTVLLVSGVVLYMQKSKMIVHEKNQATIWLHTDKAIKLIFRRRQTLDKGIGSQDL